MTDGSPTSPSWGRIFELFHDALARPAAEREAFLRERCGHDEPLRREVLELLAAHDGDDTLLDQPPREPVTVAAPGDAPSELRPGTVLADRFEVIRPLGSGGMASVYQAWDRELQTQVALKALRPEIASSPEALSRFRKEIALARQITHPNVCRLHDLFRHQRADGSGLYFVTMELIEGETLAAHLRREGPLTVDQLRPIVEQILDGLGAAHRVGVVHRDLKPGNVMLTPDRESGGWRAVVADFGLAVSLGGDDDARLTRAGELVGTPAYMAPEQLTGDEVTPATDIYALGLLLYEALTGELPFPDRSALSGALRRLSTPSPSPRTRVPGLPATWERTVSRCLRREPGERFASVAEVESSLRGEDGVRPSGVRSRRWLAVAATLALAVTVLVVWRPWAVREREAPAAREGEATGVAERAETLWVLITDFENRTGQELLDGVLESALRRELANSPTVDAVPRDRIADTLQLMQKPVDSVIDAALGREVCQRDGGIGALLVGAAEKLGGRYQLSTEVVRPADGVVLASLEEVAPAEEEVLAAVHRLANGIRGVLGETSNSIQESERGLARVTTPSLRALQLYTQAEDLSFVRDNRAAEELLRQAVAEDPSFAAAWSQLAQVLQMQDRPEEEYLPLAERALELADTTPPAERYQIRGRYFATVGRFDDAIASWRALAELQPGGRAEGDLAILYAFDLGRYEQAVPHLLAASESAPNSWFFQFQVARALTCWRNAPLEAAPHAARSSELLTAQSDGELLPLASFFASWVRSFPAHLLWLEGDVDGVARLADAWLEELRTAPLPAAAPVSWDLIALTDADLGRLERALEASRIAGARGSLAVAAARGDVETLRRALSAAAARPLAADQSGGGGADLAIGLARLGQIGEARTVTEVLAARHDAARSHALGRRPTAGMVAAAQGELALAEGRSEEARPLLERANRELRASGLVSYFRVTQSLATLLEERGDRREAVRLLEEASAQRGRLHPASKLPWMQNRLLLAELYHADRRDDEARRIARELRGLLALAEPDVALLRPLGELEALLDPPAAGAASGR